MPSAVDTKSFTTDSTHAASVLNLDSIGKFPETFDNQTLCRVSVPITTLSAVNEDENGDVTFWATVVDKNKTPNRKGFVFDWASEKDVVIKNFLKNPAMLYAHESWELTVGRWEKVEVSARRVRMFGRIPGGEDYDDIKPLRVRVRDGYLRGVSIGLYILDYEEIRDPKTSSMTGAYITKFEIVECSPCSIGAHEGAVIDQSLGEVAHDATRANSLATRFKRPTADWNIQDLYDAQNGGVFGKLYQSSDDDSQSGSTQNVSEHKPIETQDILAAVADVIKTDSSVRSIMKQIIADAVKTQRKSSDSTATPEVIAQPIAPAVALHLPDSRELMAHAETQVRKLIRDRLESDPQIKTDLRTIITGTLALARDANAKLHRKG